jgi:hypothetical protein
MPLDWDSVMGKITRSLRSWSVSKLSSTSSPVAPAVRVTRGGVEAKRVVGSIVTAPSGSMIPDLNVSEETCPSPTARRLKMKLVLPSGTPV